MQRTRPKFKLFVNLKTARALGSPSLSPCSYGRAMRTRIESALNADLDQLPRCQSLESAKQGRDQGAERIDPVRGGDKDNHGNWQGVEALLMGEILICCQEGVEHTSRELQQLAVSGARPAHRRDRADLVPGQQQGERPRQRFIEKDAHRRSADL